MSSFSEELVNALQGKTKSKTGLNLPGLKAELSSIFKDDEQDIQKSNRKELENKYGKLIPIDEGKAKPKYNANITQKFRRSMYKLRVYGYTSRHEAMSSVTLENYLKDGADPNTISIVSTNQSIPALFLVIMSYKQPKTLKKIELLLKYGADPNYISTYHDNYYFGDSPLHVTLKSSSYPVETVKLLIQHGADPYEENKDGINVFDKLEEVYGKMGGVGRRRKPDDDKIYKKIHEILETGYGKNIKG